jgi:hypothetical protein
MAMGRRPKERQDQMWVEAKRLSKGPGHPFYGRLNEVLAQGGFDVYVEETSMSRSCVSGSTPRRWAGRRFLRASTFA